MCKLSFLVFNQVKKTLREQLKDRYINKERERERERDKPNNKPSHNTYNNNHTSTSKTHSLIRIRTICAWEDITCISFIKVLKNFASFP